MNPLNATVYLAQGLVALIKSVEDLQEEEIYRALESLHNADPRVRNIGLAPDNVLRYIYPRGGNEEAIGLRYQEVPLQWPGIAKAMNTRQTVVVGPVELVQGGVAVISRTPVFMRDGRYWGVISIVIDLPGVMRDAGVKPLMEGVQIQILGGADGSGQRGWIIGKGSVSVEQAIEIAELTPLLNKF